MANQTAADRDAAAALLTACLSDAEQVNPIIDELVDTGRLPYVALHLAALVLAMSKALGEQGHMTVKEYLQHVTLRMAVTDIPPLDGPSS